MTQPTNLFLLTKKVLDEGKDVLLYTESNSSDVIKRAVYYAVDLPALINVGLISDDTVSMIVTHVNVAKDLTCYYQLNINQNNINLTAQSPYITPSNINIQDKFQTQINQMVYDLVAKLRAVYVENGVGLKHIKPPTKAYH